MTIPELTEVAPNYDWTDYFKETGLSDPGEFIVSQPDFFAGISKMMKRFP
jgi:hypothetical protein